ncbi:crossover junction endonuclease EME1 isoform X2 [Ambystoma mexicanum]|uniref:crossover junction endonuclease EME1 isoform X2 n=1 Tax=Ambystoma mexicanum TaxID=8296 RepID=UPI0037E8F6EA
MGPQKVLDESSESDHEHLPRFGFLQQQNSTSSPPVNNVILLESSDSGKSDSSSPDREISHSARKNQSSNRAFGPDITMISSESEEEEIVSLSERLKGRFTSTESFPKRLASTGPKPGSAIFPCDDGDIPAITARLETAQMSLEARGVQLPISRPDGLHQAPKETKSHMATVHKSHSWGSSAQLQAAEMLVGPPQKKVKRSVEDIETGRQEALKKKKEREIQEQEKARKKALAEALKAQRPEECLKHLQVLIDPALLQVEGGGLLLSALQAMECSCVVDSRPVPCSISWRRRTQDLQICQSNCLIADMPIWWNLGLLLPISPSLKGEENAWMDDPSLLVLVPQKDFISMIQNSRKGCQSGEDGRLQTLRSFSTGILQRNDAKSIALVVLEMEKYFKCKKTQSQKQLRQAVLSESAKEGQAKQRKKKKDVPETLPLLSRVDVEEALVEVQLHTGVQVRFLESWKEFGEFASMFTKAVAEAPFKRQRDDTSFSFYLENDWAGGVRVDRCGRGLLQVWKRQLQQLNRVSVEIANAVVSAYSSPRLLAQAYRQCASISARHDLLSDIFVRRGEGVTSTSRRVGPELSKRIYLQLTSMNPELSLEVTA